MNKTVKTALIVGGAVVATGFACNYITGGAVVDAVNDLIHGAGDIAEDVAETIGDGVAEAAEAVADATAQ